MEDAQNHRAQLATMVKDLLMAASVFTLLPILLLFLFAQRYFIESVNLSGLRG